MGGQESVHTRILRALRKAINLNHQPRAWRARDASRRTTSDGETPCHGVYVFFQLFARVGSALGAALEAVVLYRNGAAPNAMVIWREIALVVLKFRFRLYDFSSVVFMFFVGT